MDNNLSLQEHMEMLGMTPSLLAFCADVTLQVVQRALDGKEITRGHANAICAQLNKSHGLDRHVGYSPEDIDGLKLFQPPAKVAAEKPHPIYGTKGK